eukprot:scaffold576639_cov45-Prasinocladus_malaysianus.AAC.1
MSGAKSRIFMGFNSGTFLVRYRLHATMPAATEVLAAAARVFGADKCSMDVDTAFESHWSQQRAKEWQLAEANMFARCACAEGVWGAAPAPGHDNNSYHREDQLGQLVSKIEALVSHIPQAMSGAPELARRLGFLWLIRWLSATAEPLLRGNSRLGHQAALHLAFHCYQVGERLPPIEHVP